MANKKGPTDTMILRIVRFRTALSMAAWRILASTHLTIIPTARARALAVFLACLPRSHLPRHNHIHTCGPRLTWCILLRGDAT